MSSLFILHSGYTILKAGIQFDEIISSPLIPASETARHISEITGKPMRLDDRLTEQNFGRFLQISPSQTPAGSGDGFLLH